MKKIDLHTHTTCSDGSLSPSALVALAKARELCCVAITDHDNTNGVEEALAAGERSGLEVIPGVELSVLFQGTGAHLLGYFIDVRNSALSESLQTARESRHKRNLEMVEKLCGFNMPLTIEDAEKKSGKHQVGRLHIAEILVGKGYAENVKEAFQRYLGKDRPAYVDRWRMTGEEAVRIIHEAGGVAVLAHPGQLKIASGEIFESQLAAFREEGLDGLEVYSSSHAPEQTRYYRQIADDLELVVTGGSDFHGESKPGIELGQMGEGVSLFYDSVELLRSKIKSPAPNASGGSIGTKKEKESKGGGM